MTLYRRYEPEKVKGTPVAFGTIAARRKLIGKRIGWNTAGWCAATYGVVTEVHGKNVAVDGDWKWAPDMQNVCLCDEEAA